MEKSPLRTVGAVEWSETIFHLKYSNLNWAWRGRQRRRRKHEYLNWFASAMNRLPAPRKMQWKHIFTIGWAMFLRHKEKPTFESLVFKSYGNIIWMITRLRECFIDIARMEGIKIEKFTRHASWVHPRLCNGMRRKKYINRTLSFYCTTFVAYKNVSKCNLWPFVNLICS